MIRKRFPKKVTLAIGDGANDVNMILQAHVGVGILGKEGQQAARSADYAIGQFKFLKPLLFVHGREDYRRNCMVVKYTFYKNVLYVIPQYYFGFWSAFSGQTLYEPFFYQLYNITMTSLPIMYYPLFDWQHTKEVFMKYPELYMKGMTYSEYSNMTFLKWFFMGIWHSIIIYWVCMMVLEAENRMMSNGKTSGFWVGGHVVYGAAVLMANMLILMKFHVHDKYHAIPLVMMVSAYFVFLWAESASGDF
jgi:phospholipid-transporting ATPase